MATFLLPEFQEACSRTSALIGQLLDSSEKLRDLLDPKGEDVLFPEIHAEAQYNALEYNLLLSSADSMVDQLESLTDNPEIIGRFLLRHLDELNAELHNARDLFRHLYELLEDGKMFGSGLARSADAAKEVELTLSLLDELPDAFSELAQRTNEAIEQAESMRGCAAAPDSSAAAPLLPPTVTLSPSVAEPESSVAEPDGIPELEILGGSFVPPPLADSILPSAPMPPSASCPAPPPSMRADSSSAAKKVRPTRVDSVAFSVLSPEKVKAGEYSSIDVYMYTKSQRRIIEKAIKSAKQAVKETEKSGFSVSRGTEVTIILTSDDVTVTDETDTRTWNGDCISFDYQFLVPEDYSRKQIAFTCQVLFGGIQITRLHFTVGLTGGTAARVPVKVKRRDCRKAFVSYSHKDEKRVLAQLRAITEVAPRMIFWLDSQSMDNGDVWRQEIRRAIRNADVFLLFWSVCAMQSDEVEKEWRYAKKKKGIRFILPVPLDPPAMCPPPEELGKVLHFNHRSLAVTEDMDGLTFASSRQFRKIK